MSQVSTVDSGMEEVQNGLVHSDPAFDLCMHSYSTRWFVYDPGITVEV